MVKINQFLPCIQAFNVLTLLDVKRDLIGNFCRHVEFCAGHKVSACAKRKGERFVGVKTLNLCDEVGFQSFDAYLCFYFSLNRALFR